MSDEPDLRTEMLDASTVRIPESLAAELELAAGDTIQWDVTDDDRLLADVVERASDSESSPDAESESDAT